jgi:S1-C subfamily serine protease
VRQLSEKLHRPDRAGAAVVGRELGSSLYRLLEAGNTFARSSSIGGVGRNEPTPGATAVASDEAPAGSRRIGPRLRLGLIAGVALVVSGGIYVATRDTSPPALDKAEVGTIASDVAGKAIKELESKPPASATVYQQILPSLVQIEANRPSSDGRDARLGAGVIVNRAGTILTALHVVDGAEGVRVAFVDGTRSAASIAATDPANDIAVLQPERGPEVVVPAVLGGGGEVGDEAYAVGHPFGYVGSLSGGVISGLDRSVEAASGRRLQGLIQFDTAVNPGNSGGPLLNRAGQVIGIVTALANPSRDGYFIGVGFAVPIGTAGGAADAPPR